MFQALFPWSDHHARQGRKKKTGGRARFFLKKAAWLAFALFVLDILVIGVLRWVPVPFSAFMLQRMLEGQSIAYRWVAWERVSPHVAVAVIAGNADGAEDAMRIHLREILKSLPKLSAEHADLFVE